MLWRKMKQNREGSAGLGFAVFSGVVSGGLPEKVTFEQRPGRGERRSKLGTWGAVFQGLGKIFVQASRRPCTWLV